MLAFLRSLSDNLIFVLLFPECPKLLIATEISLCLLFSPVFIPSLGHCCWCSQFWCHIFADNSQIYFSVCTTDPVLALPLLCLIAFMTFQVWIDAIKLSQVELWLKELSQYYFYICILFFFHWLWWMQQNLSWFPLRSVTNISKLLVFHHWSLNRNQCLINLQFA